MCIGRRSCKLRGSFSAALLQAISSAKYHDDIIANSSISNKQSAMASNDQRGRERPRKERQLYPQPRYGGFVSWKRKKRWQRSKGRHRCCRRSANARYLANRSKERTRVFDNDNA